jgi:PAS domain S-box-containing protein
MTIITADLAGRVTWVSPSAEKMFGYEPEELVGWPVAELLPGGLDEARQIMRRLRSEGDVRNYVTTFPGFGGRRVPVSASISFVRDDAGSVTGTVGVLEDLSAD